MRYARAIVAVLQFFDGEIVEEVVGVRFIPKVGNVFIRYNIVGMIVILKVSNYKIVLVAIGREYMAEAFPVFQIIEKQARFVVYLRIERQILLYSVPVSIDPT